MNGHCAASPRLWHRWVILAAAFWLALATMAPAQTPDPATTWEAQANRVEQALASDTITIDTLEELRSQMVAQRAEALDTADAGNLRLRTLNAQLDSLGAAPAEGATEPEANAKRRAELLQEIAVASEPTLNARQAFARADVLVQEIDRTLRALTTNELLQNGPTPLSPSTWEAGFTEVSQLLQTGWARTLDLLTSPATQDFATRSMVIGLLLCAAGLIIVVLTPFVVTRLERRLKTTATEWHRRLFLVGASLTRLIVLLAGWGLVAAGLTMGGSRLGVPPAVLSAIISLPFLMALSNWLGHTFFSPSLPDYRLVELPEDLAATGVRWSSWLGLILFAELVLEGTEPDRVFSLEARAALASIIVVTGGVTLWQLAGILLKSGRFRGVTVESARRVVEVLARLIQLAVIAAIIASFVGYVLLARQALVPTAMSLGTIAAALTVYRMLISLPQMLPGTTGTIATSEAAETTTATQTLLPVVVGFLVIVLCLPVFALIWGARNSDLVEIWTVATQGVDIAGNRVSLGTIVTLLGILVIGLLITRWLQGILRTTVLPRTQLDSGGRSSVVTGFGYIGTILSVILAVVAAGLDLSTLAIVAGALSVGIGFGLQAIASNFVSGIILLVERPMKEGDWIEVSGYSGIVRKIAVRSTRIETFDRHDVIIPNSDLITGVVKNMNLSSNVGRVVVPVGVAYGSDLNKTREILLEAAKRSRQVQHNPPPQVLLMGFGDSSLDFELRCFIADVNATLSTRSELLLDIHDELEKAKISVPFPQRDVWLHTMPAKDE